MLRKISLTVLICFTAIVGMIAVLELPRIPSLYGPSAEQAWLVPAVNEPRVMIAAPDSTVRAEFETSPQAPAAPQLCLPTSRPATTLIAVGDMMLSRTVAAQMRLKGFDYPFQKMNILLGSGDVVFGNLETPITAGRVVKPGEMSFRADPGIETYLARAGFDALSLANNHLMNYGESGLRDTLQYLDAAGIKHAGAGLNADEAHQAALVSTNGIDFVFLAYETKALVPVSYEAVSDRGGVAFMDTARMTTEVRAAKKADNIVVVSMHAGVEYAPQPSQEQINFARAAIDAGADLVIGHHPHVVQTIERYKGKLIFYSLGNFIFDQTWSRETQDGLAVKLTFGGNELTKVDLLPVIIADACQPIPAAGEDANRILRRLGTTAAELNESIGMPK
jgi:poly-gamma-glutamate capsule biosynthesis protein CapA/YwtB (metallophosphatase superfamily)